MTISSLLSSIDKFFDVLSAALFGGFMILVMCGFVVAGLVFVKVMVDALGYLISDLTK